MPPSPSNPPNTGKKTSGLSGLELEMVYQSLIGVKSLLKTTTAANEASASVDPQPQDSENLITFEPDFEETLIKVLQMMRSKFDEPQILSFSGMNQEDLSQLNIKHGGSLKLKTDYKVRVAATEKLGNTEHWSSDGLYRHLCVLQKLVPRNEAASRTWIDPFFFRVSAMVPRGKQMVLSLGQSVPAATVQPFGFTTLGSHIDYTAISERISDAEMFLAHPRPEKLKDLDSTFFVSEAKTSDISLEDHVPRAVCEIYACAKQIGKNIIRGAVTDGLNWIFLVLKMNTNDDGAIYAQSFQRTRLMDVVNPGDEEISRIMCDVIAGIIAHWSIAAEILETMTGSVWIGGS